MEGHQGDVRGSFETAGQLDRVKMQGRCGAARAKFGGNWVCARFACMHVMMRERDGACVGGYLCGCLCWVWVWGEYGCMCLCIIVYKRYVDRLTQRQAQRERERERERERVSEACLSRKPSHSRRGKRRQRPSLCANKRPSQMAGGPPLAELTTLSQRKTHSCTQGRDEWR